MNSCKLCLALIVAGMCFVMGCRSGGTQLRTIDCDFICFEDVGSGDYWNYPFTICINYPTKELKNCIGRHLVNYDFGPEDTLLDIVQVSPGDFRKIQLPISDFISNVRPQPRGSEEYGAVSVTILYGSKVQSKEIGRDDYKVLTNQIPVEVLKRYPRLATGLQRMIKIAPIDGAMWLPSHSHRLHR